mmetsp:Transcript_15871/g.25410  ORF Transcript_15871/g.25410 Transcript_15871/m.25410 type:complete len:136 (+) Transcript_15871:421-828(+)
MLQDALERAVEDKIRLLDAKEQQKGASKALSLGTFLSSSSSSSDDDDDDNDDDRSEGKSGGMGASSASPPPPSSPPSLPSRIRAVSLMTPPSSAESSYHRRAMSVLMSAVQLNVFPMVDEEAGGGICGAVSSLTS